VGNHFRDDRLRYNKPLNLAADYFPYRFFDPFLVEIDFNESQFESSAESLMSLNDHFSVVHPFVGFNEIVQLVNV
jgi:hypothetical protein